MSIEEQENGQYTDAKKGYIELRDEVIAKAKVVGVDGNTVERFLAGTNKWLENISNPHTKINELLKEQHDTDTITKLNESKKEIDSILAHLLKFATFDNQRSLSKIQDILESSEQNIKYIFNLHVEENNKDLSNYDDHIRELLPTLPKKGRTP